MGQRQVVNLLLLVASLTRWARAAVAAASDELRSQLNIDGARTPSASNLLLADAILVLAKFSPI